MPVHADPNDVQRLAGGKRARLDTDLRWWLEPEERLHERVWAVAQRMMDNLRRRRQQSYIYTLLYNDVDAWALYLSRDSAGYEAEDSGRIALNVVQNAIDTATAMVAKSSPKPLFLTDGADYDVRMRAEGLTSYVAAVIEDADVYALEERSFTLGGVTGLGGLKFFGDPDRGRVCCELVPDNEILVDELDGIAGCPTQLHQRKYYAREVLAEMFPEQRQAILDAGSDLRSGVVSKTIGDVIPVVESWHIRSGPKATDGVHAISIQGATLLREAYEKDRYPIVFWRWYPMSSGFWGRGIAQELGRLQRTINKILRTIDEAQDLMGVPLWFVGHGTIANWDQLMSNDVGRAVEYTGEKPEQAVAQIVAPELYEHLWNLVQRSYEIVGISQGFAQGQKPAGVDSGAGIREVADIASGRLQVVAQRRERMFVEIAELIVDISRDLYTENPDLAVMLREQSQLREIRWKDVDLEADRFRITVFPISGLPSTPAGRIQTITEWMQAGWITKEQSMSLLDFPDLRQFKDLETATMDLVQMQVGEIKKTDRYGASLKPVSQMNLNLAMQLATMEKVRACVQKLPDSVLLKLDRYLEDLNDLMAQQAPPPAPPPPPGPGGPQGPPMPVGAPPPPMPQMPTQA